MPTAQGSITNADVFTALDAKIVVSTDGQPCVEAIARLDACYKVTIKS
jgi:hypothetical protein